MTLTARFCEFCGRSVASASRRSGQQWRNSYAPLRNLSTSTGPSRATSRSVIAYRHPAITHQPATTHNASSHSTSRILQRPLSRPFTNSSPTRAGATAIQNPRTDEQGDPMTLDITPRASQRLSQIMATDSNPELALRITVESGGCHGFQYLMSLTDLKDNGKNDVEEDTIFEGEGGAKVVMDEASLEIMKGSVVDYTMELIGSQFKVVNPHATSSCGCGTSFDIKV